MKLEGRQYTNREDLGGQGLFQTLMCTEGILIFHIYRGLYWAVNLIFITAASF